ncbi:MAG: hypothetical protein WAT37_18790, partial [Saprospiraceae bacterium]
GIETSILDLANTINTLTENKTPIDLKPARDWDTSGKRFGSTVKSKEKLGFEAKTTIEDGLRETISWTRARKDFIASTMKRYAIFVPDVTKY